MIQLLQGLMFLMLILVVNICLHGCNEEDTQYVKGKTDYGHMYANNNLWL